MNPWHNEKRITVTNHVHYYTKTHVVIKRGTLSGRVWVKTGFKYVEYPGLAAARGSEQMRDATLPF